MWKILAQDGWTGQAYSRELRAVFLKEPKPEKKVFVVCRHIVHTHINVAVFYGVCTTMDLAQALVDDLTKREGPTFVIVDSPLDP